MSIQQLESIAIGDVITITDNLRNPTDHSFQGWPLTVVAIDSPFLAVRSSRYIGNPFDLDARQFTFKKLSEEYAAALSGIAKSDCRGEKEGQP